MKENHISWVSAGQLAITSGEMNIRIWNLKNDDNFVLSYDSGDCTNKSMSEFITCLDYCASKRTFDSKVVTLLSQRRYAAYFAAS